jgi:hypothetical protein
VAYVHPSFMEDEPLFNLPACLTPLHSFGERGTPGYVQGGERRMRPLNGTGKEKVIATELLLVGRFWCEHPPPSPALPSPPPPVQSSPAQKPLPTFSEITASARKTPYAPC